MRRLAWDAARQRRNLIAGQRELYAFTGHRVSWQDARAWAAGYLVGARRLRMPLGVRRRRAGKE